MVPDVLLSCREDIEMPKSAFYFMTLWILLMSFDASSARCRNLSLKYNFPAQIDITNKKVGDQLYTFGQPGVPLVIAGQCMRATSGAGNTNGNYIYIIDKFGAGPSVCPNGGTIDKTSSDGILRYRSTGSCNNSSWLLVLDYKIAGSGYTNLVGAGGGTDSGIVYLQKKPPAGKTVVNPTYMLTRNFYSRIGQYSTTEQKETVSFSAPTSMTLVNNASCAVSVNDVAFGDQTATNVQSNTIASKTININFTCNTVLPAYTISFSGRDGGSPNSGIISVKDNSSVGYQLTWGNGTIKPANSAVVTNGITITPNTKPTTNNFTVPVIVKPVALSAQAIPGLANTALTINVKLN